MGKKSNKQKARLPTKPISNNPDIARKVVNTGYSESGASFKKGSLAGWNPIKSSPQSDIDVNLKTLRARSADLVTSYPIASSAINTSRTNVIGAGLKISPKPKYKILNISAEKAEEWSQLVKEEFDLWAGSKHADLFKKNSWYDLQDIAYQCYLIDGDSFAVFKYREPNQAMPYSLRIQLVEASRVSSPGQENFFGFNGLIKNHDNGNRIVNGIEIDSDGAVVAYWICNRYPYDPTNYQSAKWVRVEAFGKISGMPNMLQICHDDRPEQYRGVPYLAPVIEVLKQVGRYTEAELTSAIIKSFFTLFFQEKIASVGGFPITEAMNQEERVSIGENDFNLGPGSLNVLPPGYEVATVDPGRSLSTYEAFSNTLIKQIGATLEQPYEVLTKAFNSSYSASRAALLQAWSAYKIRRIWFSRDFCQPCYEAWLTEAIALGRIEAPGFFDNPLIKKAWCNADWYGPVMGVLDPVKEVQASAMRVQCGISTREKESAEMTGTSFDENIERLAVEQKRMDELNIKRVIPNSLSIEEDLKKGCGDS